MMRNGFLTGLALITAVLDLSAGTVAAQELRHRHRAVAQERPAAVATPVTYRDLTISRPPESPSQSSDDLRDIYRDGPVRYNDIRDFSPVPTTTSGVQFPYGLDGIGGYGSDLGFSAGQDTALYDRGAGSGR